MAVTIPKEPNVPKPPIFNLGTDYMQFGLSKDQANEIILSRFFNRNGGQPEFIVLHVQDGTTPGSLKYWSDPAVQASSTVMANKDGSILQIIGEAHGPWTNGDTIAPTAEANEILAYGGNPNNWSLTIEGEGGPTEALTPAQKAATVWQVQTWLIKYPHILEHNWSILRHRFINSANRWRCPDEATDPTKSLRFQPVVDAINAWLGSAEAEVPPVVPPGPTTPEPPASIYPEGMTPELAARLYGSVKVRWASKPFVFDDTRSECQYWLARGKLNIKEGEDYTHGEWPELDKVVRRGTTKNVHVFQWSNGDVYQKVIRQG